MGNTLSRGTLDVIYILFPFVLSAGLIIMIVVCWWKFKIIIDRRRPGKPHRDRYPEQPDFGHLINIQEYAENQVGTTIVYADSPGSSCPHPYVYFSDGRITRIVPLTPFPNYGMGQHHDHSHSTCPSVLLCNNLPRTRNNNMNYSCHSNHNQHYHHLHPQSQNEENNRKKNAKCSVQSQPQNENDVECKISCGNEVPSTNTNTSCASASASTSEFKTETFELTNVRSTDSDNCEIEIESAILPGINQVLSIHRSVETSQC